MYFFRLSITGNEIVAPILLHNVVLNWFKSSLANISELYSEQGVMAAAQVTMGRQCFLEKVFLSHLGPDLSHRPYAQTDKPLNQERNHTIRGPKKKTVISVFCSPCELISLNNLKDPCKNQRSDVKLNNDLRSDSFGPT